jgi:two-component system response regulator YesN
LCEEKLALVIQRLRALRDEGRLVADIKRFIHRNFASPDLSIEGISREVRLSAAYVCRLFKEAAGQTVHSYITQYRLERARELLSDRKLPKMSEVASRTGFADANYFARVFRKATGLTPSQYRERALS